MITEPMYYLSEFVGSLIFLLGGYAYMCNINLKKTLVGKLNYIELTVAWSLAVGFALAISLIMGGPACLNPGVVFGQMIWNKMNIGTGLLLILMEFLGAGAAVLLCMVFFNDSFKATPEGSKRGIFSAYPVEKNYVQNFIQEFIATFFFLFLVFMGIALIGAGEDIVNDSGAIVAHLGSNPALGALIIGMVGFGAVALLSLTLNSTGFSMNAMRSFFSSVWFAILPIPNKNGEKVDWAYQFAVNFVGSSLGGIAAVIVTTLIKNNM